MNKIKELATTLHEVFRTDTGVIFQSDAERCLLIDFDGRICKFTFPNAVRLKNAIDTIDIDKILLDSYSPVIEIISLHGCEHVYILSVLQIIEFRELLHGTFVMFQLNNIIKDCLYRIAI